MRSHLLMLTRRLALAGGISIYTRSVHLAAHRSKIALGLACGLMISFSHAYAESPMPACVAAEPLLHPFNPSDLSSLSRYEQSHVKVLVSYIGSSVREKRLALLRTRFGYQKVLDRTSIVLDLATQCEAYAVNETDVVSVVTCGRFIVEPKPSVAGWSYPIVLMSQNRANYIYLSSEGPWIREVTPVEAQKGNRYSQGNQSCILEKPSEANKLGTVWER